MGMGESTDADFRSIYDLFGERTFDNRKGGWSYEYLTSYGLPDWGLRHQPRRHNVISSDDSGQRIYVCPKTLAMSDAKRSGVSMLLALANFKTPSRLKEDGPLLWRAPFMALMMTIMFGRSILLSRLNWMSALYPAVRASRCADVKDEVEWCCFF